MTKEERVEKWFSKVPESKSLDMVKKKDICDKVARRMLIIFILIFSIECILLFITTNGSILGNAANFLNIISEGGNTKNHYKGVALVGCLLLLPTTIYLWLIPLTASKEGVSQRLCKPLY